MIKLILYYFFSIQRQHRQRICCWDFSSFWWVWFWGLNNWGPLGCALIDFFLGYSSICSKSESCFLLHLLWFYYYNFVDSFDLKKDRLKIWPFSSITLFAIKFLSSSNNFSTLTRLDSGRLLRVLFGNCFIAMVSPPRLTVFECFGVMSILGVTLNGLVGSGESAFVGIVVAHDSCYSSNLLCVSPILYFINNSL